MRKGRIGEIEEGKVAEERTLKEELGERKGLEWQTKGKGGLFAHFLGYRL